MRFPEYYWQRWLFPELVYFETNADLHEALKRATPRATNLTWVLAGSIGYGLARGFYGPWFKLRGMIWVFQVGSILVWFAVMYMAYWMSRSKIRRSLREQLRERGILLCIECGYDLRGTTGSRCSECGYEFEPIELASKTGDDG